MSGGEGPRDFEGAGILSSYADLSEALHENQVDPLQVLATGAGVGLDTLRFVVNPLNSLITAGIGWLIEHIDFLSEPLDALAGDPDEIRAQAEAWHHVSTQLLAVAVEYDGAAGAVTGRWYGTAATAYEESAQKCIDGLQRTAADAARLSDLVVGSGAMVGAIRAVIRDEIASFIAKVIQWVLAALATSVATAGFSLAALIAAVVEQAVWLARMCARRIRALLNALDQAGATAASLAEPIRYTATGLARATGAATREVGLTPAGSAVVAMRQHMTDFARDPVARVIPDQAEGAIEAVNTAAERVGASAGIELGKQWTSEEQKQRKWE